MLGVVHPNIAPPLILGARQNSSKSKNICTPAALKSLRAQSALRQAQGRWEKNVAFIMLPHARDQNKRHNALEEFIEREELPKPSFSDRVPARNAGA